MKEFEGFDHGKGKIKFDIIPKPALIMELRPIQIHFKEDGSLKDKPSFAIVMDHPTGLYVYGQITLEMFNDGLKDIGYKIEKI